MTKTRQDEIRQDMTRHETDPLTFTVTLSLHLLAVVRLPPKQKLPLLSKRHRRDRRSLVQFPLVIFFCSASVRGSGVDVITGKIFFFWWSRRKASECMTRTGGGERYK